MGQNSARVSSEWKAQYALPVRASRQKRGLGPLVTKTSRPMTSGAARTMPMVFLTHFPIFTAITQYTEGTTVKPTAGNLVKNGKQLKLS